jgi:hypothetical protein
MIRRERGAAGIFIFVVLLLAMGFLVAMFTFSRKSTAVDEQTESTAALDKIAAALEQYSAATGRLPCPADPTLDAAADTGVEAVSGGSCTTGLAGTVPWKTVGLGRQDTFDVWGWRISYRVYSATAGGFTQPTTAFAPTNGGASMVNCNTAPRFDSGLDASGFCRSDYTTSADDFQSTKGLTVNEYTDVSAGGGSTPSAVHTGVAYVLISHGQSGLGAYTASGNRRDLPANGPERDNTASNSNTSPPVSSVAPASSPDISPSTKGHFDDIVLYRTIGDLVRRTGLTARAWPFSLTLQSALGTNTPPVLGSSLGVSTLTVGGAQIGAGSISGGQLNLSYDAAGGVEGFGVFGGGGGTGISGNDYITATFAQATTNKVALSLSGLDNSERATLVFLRRGSIVGSTVTLQGCRSGSGALANFTLTPGVSYDEIGVTSWPYSSSFLLSAVTTCSATASTCLTSLDNGTSPPSGNHCS